MSMLQINNLEKQTGSFKLGPLSLDMQIGEYLVLLGPTGCGKTTLLNCLAGAFLTEPASIKLDNQPIGNLAPHHRRVGYVVQGDNLFPHLTTKENIAFGLAYQSNTKEPKDQLLNRFLEMFDLTKKADQSVTTLSGGEKRRVAIARTMITKPKLLLLDEPLSMLDHNGRLDMVATLKMIHHEFDITTIHVTHDRLEAWNIAKSCAVMNHGNLLQKGSVHDLFRKPKHRFTAEFLGGINILGATFSNNTASTQIGNLTLAYKPDFNKGYIFIRPEQIKISTTKESNSLEATLISKNDFGAYTEYSFALQNNVTLTVHATDAQHIKLENNQKSFLLINQIDWHAIEAGETE